MPILQRRIPLVHEKDVEYSGISALRFIPQQNVLGTPDETDPERRNEENKCYCLRDVNSRCFMLVVLHLAPYQQAVDRKLRQPVALSPPHFYTGE